MIDAPRLVLLFIATLLAPFGYTHSTEALAQAAETGSKLGSIRGRVLADGQAITNASVTVSNVNSQRQSRAVPTNDNGDFEVRGLESGLYRVEVTAPAHVTITADSAEEIHRVGESITVNMIRGGVITGRVVGADNDPVVAVRVRAIMIRDLNGRLPTTTVSSNEKLTDDRGAYRIFGLVPGTYVVFAGGRGFSGTGANAFDNDAPTFAPSSTRDTAEEISVASGEEKTADIRYRRAAGHAVSGNVIVTTAPNSAWLTINLARVVGSTVDFRQSTFQNVGRKGFEFQGVANGDYLIWTAYASRAGETLVSEPRRITVKGADVTGIDLVANPLASLAGVVVLEPSKAAECKDKLRPLFEETLVSLQRNKKQIAKEGPAKDQQLDLPFYSSSQASLDRVGGFQLRNLAAGQYHFNLRTFAKYWYLRSVTLPAAKDPVTSDLTRNLLNLKAGDRVTGVKATLAEGAASISGQIELPEERRSGRLVFYVVPSEKDKADDALRYSTAPVDEVGSFNLDHLPPGRYWTLVKVVAAENEANAAELRLPAASATRLKLRREGEAAKSEIELRPCQSVMDHKPPFVSN